jgi:hypothetical protein
MTSLDKFFIRKNTKMINKEIENPMVLGDCDYDCEDHEEEKAEEFYKKADMQYEEYVEQKLENR